MKFLSILTLLPPVAAGWGLLPRLYRSPLVVYSPEAMFQQQRALMQNAFTQTSPRYEITDTNETFHIDIDVPGLAVEDIDVHVEDEGRILSVTGSKEKKDENYSYKSKFSQSFSLDPTIEIDKVTASVKKGVLSIDAPKDPVKVEEMIRKIEIESHDEEEEEKEEKLEVKEDMETPITVEHTHKEEKAAA